MAHPKRGPLEWRAHVYQYRGDGIGNGVRVLLIMLSDYMNAERHVSVPRSKLAAALNISTAEVTTRIKAAKDAGLLDTVQSGKPGRTAVYQGLFSLGNHGVTKQGAQHGTGNPTPKAAQLGNHGVSASTRRSATRPVVYTSPDAHQKTQQQDAPGPACRACSAPLVHPWAVEDGRCFDCKERGAA